MSTNKELFLKHLGQTSSSPLMLEIVKAEGVFMYGPSGEKYLDLISGVSVSNTGHRHPKVVQAVREQVDNYMHLMVYGELIQSPQVKYAEYITSFLPASLNSIYFVNSGSEAVEGSLKLAKRYTGRSKIVSFENAYHGSTHGALSVQGSELYRNAFRPLLPDTFMIRFNDADALSVIDDKTACVIIEPVQGEGGVIFPEEGFLQLIRQKCTSTNSLLIFDEIQTGFGRTGHMFAIDRFKVVPDILLLAKAMGGGMPLGAFVSSAEIMSSLTSKPTLGHITTFGGHPVCCAAGLASMKILIEEELIGSCAGKSKLFRDLLQHDLITGIRGEGLLLAVQLAHPDFVRYAVARAPEFGLILDYFLFCDDAFRIAPPLTINEEEVSLACLQICKLLDDARTNGMS
ncbi:MAG TPA: aspartate aminotransferase family protein [Bacteroidales bacterium]|jgi:acetylornithine/N-succinyldiaminopimelate aminotransferase|nr:aspartate aminotransferase family protein [Bacteroidales bacterium]HBZ20473.1 aspartate aminotransferase family protein [Bacteroidales bacterium]